MSVPNTDYWVDDTLGDY